MESEAVIKALAALAQASRLQIFRALVVTGDTGMSPGELAEQLQVLPNTLSFHLKELMNAGLVTQERDGRRLIYRVGFAQMNAVMSYLTANCCQGQACELQDVTQCAAC